MEMEVVDHDSGGLKIVGHTIRFRVNDGSWIYGLEVAYRDMKRLADDFGIELK
jgi:hypothetical protein